MAYYRDARTRKDKKTKEKRRGKKEKTKEKREGTNKTKLWKLDNIITQPHFTKGWETLELSELELELTYCIAHQANGHDEEQQNTDGKQA